MTDVLKKIGNKESSFVSSLKSLPPNEGEAQTLAENQKQAEAVSNPYKAAPTSLAPTRETSEKDKVNPLGKYGDRADEKRIDTSSMTSPLGSVLPSYDEGGDVPKDQVALVHEGEKVLSPEEADQYRKEHEEKGAPADFNGPVFPNPKGLKVIDSDNPEPKPADTDHLPKGVSVKTDNAPLKTPDGDISNPLPADVQPEQGREVSTQTLKPYSQVVEEKAKAKAAEQVNNPNAYGQPSTANVEGTIPEEKPKEEKPKATYGHILADQWLQKNGMPSMDSFMAPKGLGLNEGSQQGGAAEQGTPAPQNNATPAPQGGMKPIVQPETAPPTSAPTGKEAFKSKIAGYDKQYQDLMDKAAQTNDPQYSEQAARVKEAKLEYEKAHPWGSPESAHPGVLGKIGHVAEQVLSRAPVSAPIMKIIPGTEGYRADEQAAAQEQAKEKSTEATQQQNANTAENSAKNAGNVSQQYAEALRDKATADATGDPKKIAAADRAVADAKTAVDESRPVAKVPTGDEPLGPELVTQYNKELADRYQVLHPGGTLPAEFMLPPTATANDYNRRHTAMEGVEKATGVQTQLDTANSQKEQQAAAHKEEQAGKVYDDYTKQVEKNGAPMEAISARATLLLHNLDAKNKQSDAQVAPELLSIASGGVGSGLRMNEAEISRVIGGRSVWDSLIAAANKVREGQGTFSDEQRDQMHKIGEYIYDRAAAVTTLYSDAKDRMLASKDSPDKVRKEYNDAKRIANQIIRQGIVPQGGKPKDGDYVFHNGQVLIVKGGKGYPALQ